MQSLLITSAANERFRRWKKITESPRAAKKLGMTLAEGAHFVLVFLVLWVFVFFVILRVFCFCFEAMKRRNWQDSLLPCRTPGVLW